MQLYLMIDILRLTLPPSTITYHSLQSPIHALAVTAIATAVSHFMYIHVLYWYYIIITGHVRWDVVSQCHVANWSVTNLYCVPGVHCRSSPVLLSAA
jgi:hypothetical protein